MVVPMKVQTFSTMASPNLATTRMSLTSAGLWTRLKKQQKVFCTLVSLLRSYHVVAAIQFVGSRSWDTQSVQVSIEKADLETSSIRTISLKEFGYLVYKHILEGVGVADVAQEIAYIWIGISLKQNLHGPRG